MDIFIYRKKTKYTSCVIILVKKIGNAYRFVAVRRRCNYGYYDIVNGRYNHKSDQSILKRLKQTTIDEKYLLLSLDYKSIYFHGYNNIYYKTNLEKKFNRTFRQDGGRRLKHLISICPNEGYLWGFPKGRKMPEEGNIACAVREFQEETKIKPSEYTFLHIPPTSYTHEDNGIIYENIYFFATPKSFKVNPRINLLDKYQSSEIIESKWMSVSHIEELFPPGLSELLSNNIKSIGKALKRF